MVQNDDTIYSFEEMQTNFANKFHLVCDLINSLNDDLKNVCNLSSSGSGGLNNSDMGSPNGLTNPLLATLNSTFTHQTMSLFNEDRLYPQFNYLVDLSKLKEAINEVSVQVNSQTANSARQALIDEQQRFKFTPGLKLHCFATTGISAADGSFWLQCTGPYTEVPEGTADADDLKMYHASKAKVHFGFLTEEISKAVRRRRIGDKRFQTYSEQANRVPEIEDKCFCLEQKGQKWQRARIVDVEKKSGLEVGNS
jgi:hypothetical protein